MRKNKELNKIKYGVSNKMEFLKKNYNVKKMGVFGSVARGEQGKKSDLDILVDFSKPIGLFDFLRLERFLSLVLKRRVDLVFKKSLKPAIKKEILKNVKYL